MTCSHPRFSRTVGARQKGETRRAQELRRKGCEKGQKGLERGTDEGQRRTRGKHGETLLPTNHNSQMCLT